MYVQVHHGHDGLLATSVEEFAAHMIRIVDDDALRARLAANAATPPAHSDTNLAANQQVSTPTFCAQPSDPCSLVTLPRHSHSRLP